MAQAWVGTRAGLRSGPNVRSHRWLREGWVLRRAEHAARGARGVVPRRGSRGARAPRGQPRSLLGGHRRSVHGRHGPRGGGTHCGGHRTGGCIHRLHRRGQHEHRRRPAREAEVQRTDRDRPHPRPAQGRVVREAGCEHGLSDTHRHRDAGEGGPGGRRVRIRFQLMGEGKYIIIAGAGKVGWNLARELLEKGNEVTVIEDNRNRFSTVEQELEHNIQYGDASELWVLERAGISRADMVIAVTGDDEDNMLICQVAKEKYLVDRIIARVNNPRNRPHFELLGIKPYVSATDLILRLLEHEVPEYGLVHLHDLPEERLEIIEMLLADDSRVAGSKVGELNMPEGSLLISILREGQGGFVPTPETVLEAGDEVLAVLDPGLEEELKVFFGSDGAAAG